MYAIQGVQEKERVLLIADSIGNFQVFISKIENNLFQKIFLFTAF